MRRGERASRSCQRFSGLGVPKPSPRRFRPRWGLKLAAEAVCLLAWAVLTFSPADAQERGTERTRPRIGMGFGYGLNTGGSEEDGRIALQVLSRTLAEIMRRSYDFDAAVYPDLAGLVRAIRAGRADVISILSIDYLRVAGDLHLTPALELAAGGRATDEYVLLVRQDSAAADIRRLGEGKLAVPPGGMGQVALLWTDCLLLRERLPAASYHFRSIAEAKDASRAMLSVFFKEADACVVTKAALEMMEELNPQVKRRLKALATSPPLLVVLVCFTPSASEEVRRDIVNAALRLHQYPGGRQILTLVKRDRIVAFRPSDLEAVAALVRERDERGARVRP